VPTKRRFKQVVKPDGTSEMVEVKRPTDSLFQLDNRDYLNTPEYAGYKHVSTVKGQKMMVSGLSQEGRESWDRIYNKGKSNGKKNGKLVHRREAKSTRPQYY